jgi:hypothetical protein
MPPEPSRSKYLNVLRSWNGPAHKQEQGVSIIEDEANVTNAFFCGLRAGKLMVDVTDLSVVFVMSYHYPPPPLLLSSLSAPPLS